MYEWSTYPGTGEHCTPFAMTEKPVSTMLDLVLKWYIAARFGYKVEQDRLQLKRQAEVMLELGNLFFHGIRFHVKM